MSDKLPRVTPREVIKVLEKIGFQLIRQSGSHKIYKNNKGVRITVPYHAGKILHPKLLKTILKDAELTVEDFKKYSKKERNNTTPSTPATKSGRPSLSLGSYNKRVCGSLRLT